MWKKMSRSKTGMVLSSVISLCDITLFDFRRHSRKLRSVRLGHHIITMQQREDDGTEHAVLMENSFKDEFDEKFGKDRGRPAHADQPQLISDAQCSQEITDIKHSSMCCLQKA